MEHINLVNNFKSDTPPPFSYVSLDTTEGSDCVGHWLWECAIFLPYIKDISKNTTTSLKILFRNRKEYKVKILADFGFYESDIAYSPIMVPFGDGGQFQTRVHPSEEEYSVYVPQFSHIVNQLDNNNLFSTRINRFRKYYIDSLPNISKTIPISYMARSNKENYHLNPRRFENMDAFCNLLNKYNVNIISVDNLDSFKAQFEIILRTKVLIVEMGSAFAINAGIIAADSHIITFNDFFADNNHSHFILQRRLIKERNNTVDIFSKGSGHMHNPFSVNLEEFEQRLIDISSKN